MNISGTYNPIDEQHPSIEELQAYISGSLDQHRSEEIARHLADCDMCSDTLEGLLELDAPEGLSTKSQNLYTSFRNKNLREDKKRRGLGLLDSLNTANTLLLALAGFLLLLIIMSVLYLSFFKPEKEDSPDNTGNRVDSLVAYNPGIVLDRKSEDYIPDTAAVDSSIASMITDPNIDYEYYDDNANPAPKYKSTYHEEIYVSRRAPNDDITNYNGNRTHNDGSTTPQSRYFGYDSRDVGSKRNNAASSKVQVGDQLIQVDKIVSEAQSYYNRGDYSRGIYFLDKYVRNIRESIPDLDYWMARLYAANGETSYARYYLERLAGYQNPYTQRAKKMLGEN